MSTPAGRRCSARRLAAAKLHALLVLAAVLAAVAAAGCGDPGSAAGGSVARSSTTGGPAPAAASTAAATSNPSAAGTRRGPAVTVAFVDVGQGDAAVVRSGSWAGVIDGGPPGSGAAVEAVLRKLGVRRLAAVVVTHPHQDHTGGLDAVIRDYRPRRAYVGEGAGTARAALRAVGAVVKRVRRGQTLRFGAVKATVLGPGRLSGDPNEDSVVLALDAGGRRLLFTGDCAGPAEAAVTRICSRGPPVWLLKVAHHGSAYSTPTSFLAAARPRVAVISAGRNSYGHPSPATLGRLRRAGVRVYTTRRNGTVTVAITRAGKVVWRFSKASTPTVQGGG